MPESVAAAMAPCAAKASALTLPPSAGRQVEPPSFEVSSPSASVPGQDESIVVEVRRDGQALHGRVLHAGVNRPPRLCAVARAVHARRRADEGDPVALEPRRQRQRQDGQIQEPGAFAPVQLSPPSSERRTPSIRTGSDQR